MKFLKWLMGVEILIPFWVGWLAWTVAGYVWVPVEEHWLPWAAYFTQRLLIAVLAGWAMTCLLIWLENPWPGPDDPQDSQWSGLGLPANLRGLVVRCLGLVVIILLLANYTRSVLRW